MQRTETVTCDAARDVQRLYRRRMFLRSFISSIPLVSLPSMAAESASTTGITSVGPGLFLFLIALALFLSLLLRRSAGHATRILSARLGKSRIERAIGRKGRDALQDFILPGAYGGLARIDYAVLTAGGIICIRTLHRQGVVFGAEDEAQWTHVDGIKRRRFLNPLIQNEGRRRALGNVVPGVPVANLVVFTGKVDFPGPMPGNVIRLADLDSYIEKYVFGPSKIDDWDAVWMSVKAAALTDDDTRQDFEAQLSFS